MARTAKAKTVSEDRRIIAERQQLLEYTGRIRFFAKKLHETSLLLLAAVDELDEGMGRKPKRKPAPKATPRGGKKIKIKPKRRRSK